MAVGGKHLFYAAEGAHQHQQSGARQVKIGEQHIHHLEAITRRNEDVGLARPGLQFAARRRAFQCAQTGGTDRDHPSAVQPSLFDGIDRRWRHAIALAVHGVILYFFRAHRLEGACPDMQGDISDIHAPVAQGLQHRFVEMQTRRRRGDRALLARKHGLVALFVLIARRMGNVGRQRQFAVALQQHVHAIGGVETQMKEFARAPHH